MYRITMDHLRKLFGDLLGNLFETIATSSFRRFGFKMHINVLFGVLVDLIM